LLVIDQAISTSRPTAGGDDVPLLRPPVGVDFGMVAILADACGEEASLAYMLAGLGITEEQDPILGVTSAK
jgi:hypothetical protein